MKFKLITRALFATAVAMVLSACGIQGTSSTLEVGQRTDVQLGLAGANLKVEIADAGIYTFYTEGDEDTVCRIVDSSGREVAEDDDGGIEYNCRINALLQPGGYTVEVSGFNLSDRGRVSAMLRQTVSEQVAVNDVLNIDLDPDQGRVIVLDIEHDGAHRLGTSGQLDTICTLYDDSGRELSVNDDYVNDQNCGMVEPLARGRYYFLIQGFDGEGGRTTFMAAPTVIERIGLSLDEQQPAHLDERRSLLDFEVTITASGMYVFSTSGETDTVCQLRDGSGQLLAENDDGPDHNCSIRHALTEGSYVFHVRGYGGAVGEFVAHVDSQ